MKDFPNMEDPAETTTRSVSSEYSRQEEVSSAAIFVRQLNQNNRTYMNSSNHHEIIVAGIHLELTPSLKTFVQEKAARLFRHEDRIVRLRFELECDPRQIARFTAKGHVEIQGPDLNATVNSEECHKAVSLLVDKLDRMLERRAQLRQFKRKHPRAIELADVAIPKVAG